MCKMVEFLQVTPSDKENFEKLKKCLGVKEEVEKVWRVGPSVVPMICRELGAVTPRLEEEQQQIPGTTSEVSVQKRAISQDIAQWNHMWKKGHAKRGILIVNNSSV